MIVRVATVVLLALLVGGCDDDRGRTEGRGARGAGESAAPAGSEGEGEAASVATVPDPMRRPEPVRDRRPFDGDEPARASAHATEGEPEAPEAAPARDLEAELRAAVGNPSSCFSAPDALAARLRIGVTAVVSLTGRITRASVDVPGVPEADVACIRERVERLVLPGGPIDGAPRTVRAEIEVERRPATPSEEPR